MVAAASPRPTSWLWEGLAVGLLLAQALFVPCDCCSAGPEWGRARTVPVGVICLLRCPHCPLPRALPVLLSQDSLPPWGQAGQGGQRLRRRW